MTKANDAPARPIQVTGLGKAAVERVRAEAVENGLGRPSDAATVRFAFMQYYRSLVRRDREEAAATVPSSA